MDPSVVSRVYETLLPQHIWSGREMKEVFQSNTEPQNAVSLSGCFV
jgi:hypothetical protein